LAKRNQNELSMLKLKGRKKRMPRSVTDKRKAAI